MSDSSRLKATIFVGSLDMMVSTAILHATFLPFGEIVDIQMPKPELPSSTDPHRGFAYVEFESAEDAREAIDNMNQSELFKRIIQVAQAKPMKDHSEGLGSKVAVWEQVRGPQTMHAPNDRRRAGLRKTPLVRRTVRRRRRPRSQRPATRCADWRSWTWPGQSPSDTMKRLEPNELMSKPSSIYSPPRRLLVVSPDAGKPKRLVRRDRFNSIVQGDDDGEAAVVRHSRQTGRTDTSTTAGKVS
jgi:hypothetical protein